MVAHAVSLGPLIEKWKENLEEKIHMRPLIRLL